MKRPVFASALFASLMSASFALAQPAPQYSTQDIVGSFARDKAAAAPAPTAKGTCEQRGMVTGEDGICEPVKNERGFSLPTRGNTGASRPAPSAAPAPRVASIPRASSAPAAAAPAARRDLLITFKSGSAELTDQAKANARVFAQAMTLPALSGSRFEIAGYTDAVGAADKNLTLSQQRAESVKGFLVANGVDGGRVVAKGYGASNFAVPSQPRAGANRRVEARRVD